MEGLTLTEKLSKLNTLHTITGQKHWAQMLKLMVHLRFSHLLRLVGPWGGKTWFCCEEEQGSSDHWTQTLGRLPAQGVSSVRLHTHTVHILYTHVHCVISWMSAGRWLQAHTWQEASRWLTWSSFQTLLLLFALGKWNGRDGRFIPE